MVVTDQINALRALGTDPIRKLVVPRLLAGFFMTPVLTVIADAVGIVGGWIIAVAQSASPRASTGARLSRASTWRMLAGAHQAVFPRLRDRDDWMSCGPTRPRRHAGRRPSDDQRRGRLVRRGHCRGLLSTRLLITLIY